MDEMTMAAMRRLQSRGGSAAPDPMALPAYARVAGEAQEGEEPSKFQRLLQTLREWFSRPKDAPEEQQLDDQHQVDDAVLRALPQTEGAGPGATLDAIKRRRQLLDDATRE